MYIYIYIYIYKYILYIVLYRCSHGNNSTFHNIPLVPFTGADLAWRSLATGRELSTTRAGLARMSNS